jgi:thiosulfate/3-mercaptopyruvate sulfurtransferase
MPTRLIETAELARRLDEPGLRLLDARPASAFAKGFIPGAVHLDVFGISLCDTSPQPLAAFEWIIHHLLELRGVTRDHPVVVYEDESGMRAARIVWFLELFGHEDVHLLDGGMRAWRVEGRPVVRDAEEPERTTLAVERRDACLATVDHVLAALRRDDTVIVDVRARDEYTGALVRAQRGGAIPGAVHVEWIRALGPDGRFLPPDALHALYAGAGITPDKQVITYCQGGYRAAHSWLALTLAGYPRVRSYLGSWNEWGNSSDLPIARPA